MECNLLKLLACKSLVIAHYQVSLLYCVFVGGGEKEKAKTGRKENYS